MKWVTFISCLFLVSFAESKHLPRTYRDAGTVDTISHTADLPADQFAAVSMVLFAQMIQKATYEDVHKLMDEAIALSKKCAADEHSDPECAKPLRAVFLDEICHEQGFPEKYGFTDCCAKVDPERNDCFLAHKNATPGFIPPFQKPEPEAACQQFAVNKEEVLGHYLYEVSRRVPLAKVVTVLKAVHGYEGVMTTCCQAEDKGACFNERAPVVKKQMLKDMAIQRHNCYILKKFKERPLVAVKMSTIAQKFPKADFATIGKLAKDIVNTHEECCRGDTLGCMLDREKLTKYVCAHKNDLSSKLSTCCQKPLLEQAECIVHLENDDKPADLSETVREFIEDKEVCQHYTDDKDGHTAKFLYEYSRRHQELAPQLLVRIAKGYHDFLETCCATEHPETCLPQGEEKLKKYIADTTALIQKHCTHYSQLGDYLYQNELLVLYAKRAPQLSFEELHKYTGKLKDGGAKCCQMDEAHRMPCIEGYLDVIFTELCQRHEEHNINKQVCKCCSDSYVLRRECITSLGPDPEYHPDPLDPALFTFHGDFCSATQEEQQKKKQETLVNLIKHKPSITDEQLATAIVDFTATVTKCCETENQEECFTEENPKLIERTKAALGEH